MIFRSLQAVCPQLKITYCIVKCVKVTCTHNMTDKHSKLTLTTKELLLSTSVPMTVEANSFDETMAC